MSMPRISRLLHAIFTLARLGWQTGFRLRGRYWRWRDETAFGRGRPPRIQRFAAVLDYADWASRMKAIGRARF